MFLSLLGVVPLDLPKSDLTCFPDVPIFMLSILLQDGDRVDRGDSTHGFGRLESSQSLNSFKQTGIPNLMSDHRIFVFIRKHRFQSRQRRRLFDLPQAICKFMLEQSTFIFQS